MLSGNGDYTCVFLSQAGASNEGRQPQLYKGWLTGHHAMWVVIQFALTGAQAVGVMFQSVITCHQVLND